ncbi:MAG: beta-phosphoglucomutase [Cyclobacteriaceae bacterium]|nr:MAG: beta-phosphoglucomutase [Cyclobacteriaceae bacterium]
MKGIIFDLDGTMVDNMMIHHRAWQRKLATLGMEMTLEEVMEQIHGINEEIVMRLFGDRFTEEERAQISWDKELEYRNIFKQDLKLIEGLQEFLQEIDGAGIPMALGTAAPAENVDFVLDNLDIRKYFSSILHSGNVSRGKPDPQIFTDSARNLGVPIENCVVFEDSVVGAETALNAGCPAIVVTTTHQQPEFAHFPHILRFIKDYRGLKLNDLQMVN